MENKLQIKIKEIRALITQIRKWPYWRVEITAYTKKGGKMNYFAQHGKIPKN